jgi:hypothetical protein
LDSDAHCADLLNPDTFNLLQKPGRIHRSLRNNEKETSSKLNPR